MSFKPIVRGVDIVSNMDVSIDVAFYQINKCFVNILFFHYWYNIFAALTYGGGVLCHAPLSGPKNKKMYIQYSAVYTKMLNFRQIALFCLEKLLSKHKMTKFSKKLGGMAPFPPLATPMLWPPSEIFCVRHCFAATWNGFTGQIWPAGRS